MDPFTLGAAILAFGYIAVVVIAITVDIITEWFRARGRIKAENTHSIAFTLAERIKNKQYTKVTGVFDKAPTTASTRIVQGLFDQRTGKVLDARALASVREPGAGVVRDHAAGSGLVIYE
ncbi:hypothetical protein AB0G67_08230 [Streptomyces sp. NPDC021056]|uniref:hypothetical protein n=1 Tax=Streptomyces sp. NPDC021056 TaxID=3155012 RepID=UPI0033E8660F